MRSLLTVYENEYGLVKGRDWLTVLKRLGQVDGSRSNTNVEGLIMMDGRVVKINQNCRKLADYILNQILPKI